MKAIRFHEYGGLDVLRYEEVPDPEVGPGEVLGRVRACALNHLDLWQRRGIPGVPLPHCPGSDVAGEVVTLFTGPGESGYAQQRTLKRGDEIVSTTIDDLHLPVDEVFGGSKGGS